MIEALPNRVTTLKTAESDGYRAVQVTVGAAPKAHRLPKAEAGHFAKAQVEPGQRAVGVPPRATARVRISQPGAEIKVDLFKEGQLVDVSGRHEGQGLRGRHQAPQLLAAVHVTHGNSLSHRAPGAIGQRQTPGRVFPGKRMAGHLGHERATTINLEVLRVDAERNVLLVKGAVPGAENGRVIVSTAAKGQPVAPKATPKAAAKEGKDGGKKDAGKKDAAKDKK